MEWVAMSTTCGGRVTQESRCNQVEWWHNPAVVKAGRSAGVHTTKYAGRCRSLLGKSKLKKKVMLIVPTITD